MESTGFLEPGFFNGTLVGKAHNVSFSISSWVCCVLTQGFASRCAAFKGVFCWYPRTVVAVVGKSRLSNHLNPFQSLHKLCLLKHLQLTVNSQGWGVFWKRENFSEEDEE